MNNYIPPVVPEQFLKPYNPTEVEARIYKLWEESGFFNPDVCIEKGATKADAPTFSIVLPPPNVTGILHLGHALAITLEDIMVRYHRMKGNRTLWIPGTDHAAIATQSKVEGIIYKEEGKRRHDLGREELLKRVNAFAQASHDTIISQTKRLGASLDWSREAYTLDEKRGKAVFTAFKKMYDDGLIYRKYRIVNWDPKGQTTISDDEIVYTEGTGKLYTFKYSKDFPISIATTRPETKVGDTGVAVHPEDPRYKQFIGTEYDINFAGSKIHIKIVGDEAVDPEFGTGAVGVTPAHSKVDWDIAERHGLPVIPVINEFAKMSTESESLNGKKVGEARELVITWLKEQGLLEKEEIIPQNLATAERTGGIIEPLPKLQWWVAVNKPFTLKESSLKNIPSGSTVTLKDLMKNVITEGSTSIVPDRFEKVYTHWIENLNDWCISRQIWFGHQIPAWYRGEEIIVSPKKPEGEGWIQDEDTLDTWFSSGLWTFSTLGWPEDTADLRAYHPTSILETAYDIIFFWVARMVLMSTYLLGTTPFKTVYIHGLVRDIKGQKLSKSLGNAIDPIEMMDKYGTDAVRMSLIVANGAGNDMKMSEDKIRAYKNFSNKLWNIARYILGATNDYKYTEEAPKLTETDSQVLEEYKTAIADITKEIEGFKYGIASEKLYHYIWHTFADIYVEKSKELIALGGESKTSSQWTLLHIFTNTLRALHPFAPFVTEEIWTAIPIKDKKLLLVERWPTN